MKSKNLKVYLEQWQGISFSEEFAKKVFQGLKNTLSVQKKESLNLKLDLDM